MKETIKVCINLLEMTLGQMQPVDADKIVSAVITILRTLINEEQS